MFPYVGTKYDPYQLDHRLIVHRHHHLELSPFTVAELSDAAPKKRDLNKAFEIADVDNSGGIDFEELLMLYAKVKRGEVDGISGGGLAGWLFGGRRKR